MPISFTYIIAITLLTISPGVDTVLVIRNTSRGGWADGATTSLGICCGLFVHATVSAVGISVILLQSAWAFRALKLAGAAYLVFLGIVSLRSAARRDAAVALAREGSSRRSLVLTRSLREGLLCNLLNPKAVVFYMAFLPQFIDPRGSAIRQSLYLAGLHFLIAMVWQCLLAALVERARVLLGSPRVRRTLDGTVGALMLFFGIKLGLER
jgi:RhtB (resistance to homoserine/threonine) family protein